MLRSTPVLALLAITLLASAASLGAEDASLGKDLKATIALHGMSCDQIVDARRNADSDYTATCKDGNRYHIFVSAEGRVVVQKLTP
jgi:hypothetical protein